MRKELNRAVIYQICLRNYTPEGTLRGAERMLPHIRDLGVDIIYLGACNTQDDTDFPKGVGKGWAARGINESGFTNVKCPYRISDYYNIDEEYGTMDDLRSFVQKAHDHGLKVMFDLVFLHCGPNAVFLTEHPDYVQRDENGEMKIIPPWPFPRLDYDKPEVCEYMHNIMEYYVREIGVDGFRCDVADHIPLDFWIEGTRRVRTINPDIIMLNEGDKPASYQAFDIHYSEKTIYAATWLFSDHHDVTGNVSVRKGDLMNLKWFKELFDMIYSRVPEGKYILINAENHDSVRDMGTRRPDVYLGSAAAEAVLAMVFTMRGVPMIYGGCEVADTLPKNFAWNRFLPGAHVVQWQNALLEVGKKRNDFVKKLIELHHTRDTVHHGDFKWYDGECGETVLAYTRSTADTTMTVLINFGCTVQRAVLPEKEYTVLLQQGAAIEGKRVSLGAYGFLIVES